MSRRQITSTTTSVAHGQRACSNVPAPQATPTLVLLLLWLWYFEGGGGGESTPASETD